MVSGMRAGTSHNQNIGGFGFLVDRVHIFLPSGTYPVFQANLRQILKYLLYFPTMLGGKVHIFLPSGTQCFTLF